MKNRILLSLIGVLALLILVIVFVRQSPSPEQAEQQGWRDFAQPPKVILGNGKRY